MFVEATARTENPEWKKNWIKYVSFNDRQLLLADNQLLDPKIRWMHNTPWPRYQIGLAPQSCPTSTACPFASDVHFKPVWVGENLETAVENFERLNQLLINHTISI